MDGGHANIHVWFAALHPRRTSGRRAASAAKGNAESDTTAAPVRRILFGFSRLPLLLKQAKTLECIAQNDIAEPRTAAVGDARAVVDGARPLVRVLVPDEHEVDPALLQEGLHVVPET